MLWIRHGSTDNDPLLSSKYDKYCMIYTMEAYFHLVFSPPYFVKLLLSTSLLFLTFEGLKSTSIMSQFTKRLVGNPAHFDSNLVVNLCILDLYSQTAFHRSNPMGTKCNIHENWKVLNINLYYV